MTLRTRIAAWTGWRRYAPTAASLAVNFALLAVFAGSLAATGKVRAPPLRTLSVELVTDLQPRLTGVPKPIAPRKPARPAARTPQSDGGARPDAALSAIAPSAADDRADEVYLAPAPTKRADAPLGLRGLLRADNPCAGVLDRLKADCAGKWSQLASNGDLLIEPSIEEMQRLFPGFAPPRFGTCSKHMGCYSDYEGEWTSLIGTRSVGLKSPMSSGPGGLGGINDMVGRLAPANPYHVDPGFGD
ncbi:MAG: hypothetical protein SGJ21_03660 [Alphaproteobacteria bacterium]|nr:hypothetical protein [Alphaproteobacteria bacterium]